jgi:hypothetical protein
MDRKHTERGLTYVEVAASGHMVRIYFLLFYGFGQVQRELMVVLLRWANTNLRRRIRSSNISWARRVRSVKRALLRILKGKKKFPS